MANKKEIKKQETFKTNKNKNKKIHEKNTQDFKRIISGD